jgi:flagellar biosynthetic protein FliO
MQKIQIIAFLTALLVGSTALGAGNGLYGSRSEPTGLLGAGTLLTGLAQMSASNASSGGEQAKRFTKLPSLLFGEQTGEPNLAGPPNSAGTRELFIKMMASVVLIVVLGAGAIYGSKRLAGKFANLPGKRIKIVETAHLGPRKAVHLLRIGDRCLLIGSTNDNISKLADLTTEILMQEKALDFKSQIN